MLKICLIFLFFSVLMAAVSQEAVNEAEHIEYTSQESLQPNDTAADSIVMQGPVSRGSIPEELLRPARGESPRFPIDTVIGELGRGKAPAAAFNFANLVADGLLSGEMDHRSLSSLSSSYRERYLSALSIINPRSYRLGGGREEADGAVSFFIRFIGRDQGITGELYIRYITRENAEGVVISRNWVFEELLLEEAKDREVEQQESIYRIDFNPYERFF